MAKRPLQPSKLLHGAFSTDEARRHGLDSWHLEGATWMRLGPKTYLWKGLRDNPMHRLEAARIRLPLTAAFSGQTAAWLHGIDVAPCNPIEVTLPKTAGISARAGMALRRSALPKGDVVFVEGMPATSIVRTIAEVCSRIPLVEAVAIADEALHNQRVHLHELLLWADSHAGRRGMKNLRCVLTLVEPATESPMESRLRMVLVLAGLPRPKAQVPIHDRWGEFVGRPDLYYEAERLGIEYDGGGHRETLRDDNRRQNKLLNAGVRLLRFTAADVLRTPEQVVNQVRTMLANPSSAGVRGLGEDLKPASAGTRGG